MEAKERMWLNADATRLVAEGDPKAATLYAAPGDEIPEEAAERFGLKDGLLKGSKPAADKAEKPEGNKGGGLKIDKGVKG